MAVTRALPLSVAAHLPEAVEVTGRVARTFALAARLLPAATRDDVYLLYLVCRTLDDLVDTRHPMAKERLAQVRAWALRGGPVVGREEAILEHLMERYPAMPREAIVDFCDGQAKDLEPVQMATEVELDVHCYRVAGTVGRLMAGVLGVRDAGADEAARALGIAMQRTNILRDIDEDLSNGRVYLPAETLQRTGVRDLARDDRRALLEWEIATADRWYERGFEGIPYLVEGAWPVRAAALMYREILREIERSGYGVVRPSRVSVSRRRKLWLVARALLGC